MTAIDRREFLKQTGAASAGIAVGATQDASATTRLRRIADPWLQIDLPRIRDNLAQIRKRVGKRRVMAVIKANAYGHGLVQTARWLSAQGVEFLAVGKLWEAVELRERGIKTPILNLGPCFTPAEANEAVRNNITQTAYADDYRLLAEAARKQSKVARLHVKVDTGLGRIGVPFQEALPLLRQMARNKNVSIDGIFTPLTEDVEYDRVQLTRFGNVCDRARKADIRVGIRHAASSAAVIDNEAAWLDMVRPGIALYGQYPSTKEAGARRIELQPAMSVHTRVMLVKTLRPGDSVSYHRAFVAKKNTRVATLAVGYSDGYPPKAAGQAEVLIGGRRCKTIALVTSNHMTVDVTGLDDVKVGQPAVLLGRQGDSVIDGEQVAAWAGTSVYKILIGMNPLLARRYDRG